MPNSPLPPIRSSPAAALVRGVGLAQPAQWLARGWRDLLRSGWISLLHGVLMALGGAVLFGLAREHSGFA